VVLGVRTYALFADFPWVKAFIWILWSAESVAYVMAVVIFLSRTRFALPNEEMPCFQHISSVPHAAGVAVSSIAMVYDVALWSMVAIKMYQLLISGSSKLVWAFYRDGPLYITLITIVNVAQVFMWQRMLNIWQLVLISNYTCRLLLDLWESVVEEENVAHFTSTFDILACQTGMVGEIQFVENTDVPPDSNA